MYRLAFQVGLIFTLFFSVPFSVFAEDLDDIELGMEDAFQDSEAAKQQAIASQKRLIQRRADLKVARERMTHAIAEAKSKEKQAKKEIAATDLEIQKLNKQIFQHQGKEAEARKRTQAFEEQIRKKREELRGIQAKAAEVQARTNARTQRMNEKSAELRYLNSQIHHEKSLFKKPGKNLSNSLGSLKKPTHLKRNPASSSIPVEVKLQPREHGTRKISSSHLKAFSKDCNLRKGPSTAAAIYTKATKGKSVSAAYHSAYWYMIPLPSGQKVYASKSCF